MTIEADMRLRVDALVDRLKAEGHIRSAAVEVAFRAVPRHLFVPDAPLDRVYTDEAIPTRFRDGVPISSSSQPAAMAIMLEQLDVRPGQRVLEIGAGTGYNAALLAHLAGPDGVVVTVDLDADITAEAAAHLDAAGFGHVTVLTRDGARGAPEYALFDRIILTVGAWDVAPGWIDQLAPGGRLLIPLWLRGAQRTVAFERADEHLTSVSVSSCAFMRLRGDFAGPEGFVSLSESGAEPMTLAVEDRSAHDLTAVRRWLDQPGRLVPVGEIRDGESLWKGMSFWLALREDGLCQVSADAEKTAHPLVPRLFGISASYRWTLGLIGARGLALVLRSEPENAPAENGDQPMILVVQAFGDDPAPANRLVAAMRDWLDERDGQREPCLRVYPKGSTPATNGAATLIPKRLTDIVVSW